MKNIVLLLMIICNAVALAQSPLDVCELTRLGKKLDGKQVTVTGVVRASSHITGVQGSTCSDVVVFSYRVGALPQDFVAGVEAKRYRLDPRPFKVVVRGTFRRKVKADLCYVSKLDQIEAISWNFEGTSRDMSKPQGSLQHEAPHNQSVQP